MDCNKQRLKLFLIALLSFLTITAQGEEITTPRLIYNPQERPWVIMYSMTSGQVATDSDYVFKDSAVIHLPAWGYQHIYYRNNCSWYFSCQLEGKLTIIDFKGQAHCYRLTWNAKPYIKHHGITGPVVLNGAFPRSGYAEYGGLTFIGGSWSDWDVDEMGRKPAPGFGQTC